MAYEFTVPDVIPATPLADFDPMRDNFSGLEA
jgi:hypothetical protein